MTDLYTGQARCPVCGRVRFVRADERNRPCSRCRTDHKPAPGMWTESAACRGHDYLSPDAWWPESRNHRHDELVKAAVEVCRSCPVRTDCLDHALAVREVGGIWGGLTDAQRREEARGRRQRREADARNRRLEAERLAQRERRDITAARQAVLNDLYSTRNRTRKDTA